MRRTARLGSNNAPRGAGSGEARPRRIGLLCRLGCHEAEPDGAFQGAHFLSRCRGCGAAMVRTGASWSMAPARVR
ncbi:hypothetical protein [Sphingosinicella sp. YJ22]|uniref:hypothetical protein n=1 Tax=Sphingosinicella sp. YJ22 TaxID=1104780 RepID=UPI00140E87D4|nr:hypothetical protein [Sphingosinicella sp. YJ22]